MDYKTFETYVTEGVAQIAEHNKKLIENVAVLIEDEPSAELLKERGLHEGQTLLGLYQGIPRTRRGGSYGIGMTLPDRITIFKNPIERTAGHDPAAIKQLVADTIWHEFAHYFGMNEAEVRKRERERIQ